MKNELIVGVVAAVVGAGAALLFDQGKVILVEKQIRDIADQITSDSNHREIIASKLKDDEEFQKNIKGEKGDAGNDGESAKAPSADDVVKVLSADVSRLILKTLSETSALKSRCRHVVGSESTKNLWAESSKAQCSSEEFALA